MTLTRLLRRKARELRIRELPAPTEMPPIVVLRQMTVVYGLDGDGQPVCAGYWSGVGNTIIDVGLGVFAEEFLDSRREWGIGT